MGFPTYSHDSQSFRTQTSVELVRTRICCDLTALNENFNSYFTNVNTAAWDWIRNPFVAHSLARGLSAKTEEELLELSCDGTQRIRFWQILCIDFWPSVKEEYPELFAAASKVLLHSPTTYFCEASFSAMTAMKTKYRAWMHVKDDLRPLSHERLLPSGVCHRDVAFN